MENKKVLLLSTAAICSVMTMTLLVATYPNAIQSAFATHQTNEYGCVTGCTGEYYPSHVKSLLQADPSLNGEKNVRIKCEYIKDNYFKDIGAALTYSPDSDSEAMVIDVSFSWWNDTTVDYRSLMKPNNTVCLFGTVSYELYGVGRLVVRDPIVYAVNDQVNTALLPEVNYID